MIILSLPFPISVNNLYKNIRKGRAKSQRYRIWANAAGWELQSQKQSPVHGFYDMELTLHENDKRHRDCANFEKCVSDLLVAHNLIDDDSKAVSVKISRVKDHEHYCSVIVRPSNGIPDVRLAA